MQLRKNLVVMTIGTALVLVLSTASVFAADAAKENGHQHQSKQSSGHGDGKSDEHHNHQCEHMMSSVDQDKDGKISKAEFMKHHETLFDKKDTNKDGFLDDTEMHQMMMKHMHKHDHQKGSDHNHGSQGDTKH